MKKEPKDEEKINVLDRQFKGLGLDEMTPLKKGSPEFEQLKSYLVDTVVHNTKYQVSEIFRIERQGEKERFQKTKVSPVGTSCHNLYQNMVQNNEIHVLTPRPSLVLERILVCFGMDLELPTLVEF